MTLNLPIATVLFLTGDMFPAGPSNDEICVGGSHAGAVCASNTDCPDGFCSIGIQACPICAGPTGSKLCYGGPNDGLACTPGTSPLGQPYPTSQDCPPGNRSYSLGALPVALSLSTGSSTISAHTVNAQPNVFCGYCFDDDDGVALYANPPVACATSADCNNVRGDVQGFGNITFERCKQGNGSTAGCFAEPSCTTITENGSAAGSLVDGGPHDVVLQSVFCIPPSFAAIVDGAADLPGPGATAIPGTIQLLP